MDSVFLDLRYAVRNLVRRPGFSALAILTLAVGIGVNTVAFTAVNAVLCSPVSALKDVDRFGWAMLSTAGNRYGDLSWPEFAELERPRPAFDIVVALGRQPWPWPRTDTPNRSGRCWSPPTTFGRSMCAPTSGASSPPKTAGARTWWA